MACHLKAPTTLKPQLICTNNAKIHHLKLTKRAIKTAINCKHKNQLDRWSLHGKTALVTGGTRGIGYTLYPIHTYVFIYIIMFCQIDGLVACFN